MNILEIMQRWPDNEAAIRHLEKVRWNGRPACPYCKSTEVCVHASKDKTLPRWQCENCHRAFSATVNTIFHHTHLPLNKWFLALAIMLNAKKNISNAQLSRDLGLPYKTAWSLTLRIRTAMLTDPTQKSLFHGIVEMDETYLGGKPRNGNGPKTGVKSKRGLGTKKLPIVGIVERHGRVIAKAFDKMRMTSATMNAFYTRYVDRLSSIVMTDEFKGYNGLKKITEHYSVNHQVAYVVGDTHTNTIDGFWALVERSIYGQHHFYSRKWANHYISETAHKYNHRSNPTVFGDLLRHMVGISA